MIESWSAHKIANLEGRKRLRYLDSSETNGTLQALDLRLQRLETAVGLRLIPPTLLPTFESLEYRIRQVECGSFGVTNTLLITDAKALTVSPKTLEDVKHVSKRVQMLALSMRIQMPAEPLAADCDEAKELLDIAQHLCYIAGQRNLKVADFDDSISNVYDLAITISLNLEHNANPARRVLPGTGLGRSPLGPPPPFNPRLSFNNGSTKCRGSCSCRCHRSKHNSLGILHPPSKKNRRWFRLPSLRKLWCFGRRSTASSISSTSTETL